MIGSLTFAVDVIAGFVVGILSRILLDVIKRFDEEVDCSVAVTDDVAPAPAPALALDPLLCQCFGLLCFDLI
jgi:hypothetical protein